MVTGGLHVFTVRIYILNEHVLKIEHLVISKHIYAVVAYDGKRMKSEKEYRKTDLILKNTPQIILIICPRK